MVNFEGLYFADSNLERIFKQTLVMECILINEDEHQWTIKSPQVCKIHVPRKLLPVWCSIVI